MPVAIVISTVAVAIAGVAALILVTVADSGIRAGPVTVTVVNTVGRASRFTVVARWADIARSARRITAAAIGRIPVGVGGVGRRCGAGLADSIGRQQTQSHGDGQEQNP